MSRMDAEVTRRIAIEVERLDQEIRVIQHVLDEPGPGGDEELVRRLRYLATRANRIAEMVERDAETDAQC
jgi:hypothetical protein